MMSHLVGFTVYTLAMIGIIFLGFVVAKKSIAIGRFSDPKSKFLTIESCLSLEPRKNLYVVRAGEEKFLISTDTEGSRFLTRLETNEAEISEETETNIIPDAIMSENKMIRRMLSKINSNTNVV